MKPGKGRSTWQFTGARHSLRALGGCAVLGLLLLTGCNVDPAVDRHLLADLRMPNPKSDVAQRYTVLCPDVLELTIAHHPELSGPHPIGIDGCIDLMPVGRPTVEGETLDEIAQQLVELTGVAATGVEVHVAQYRSQCIFVFGEVMGLQRAVPYDGQETVLELLQRTGGITTEAAPERVYVVRPHVMDGGRPEIFHVDLRAIVLRHDERTNIRLQPFDQVHVGETRRAGLERCVPPWLRPLYRSLCGLLPAAQAQEEIQNKSQVPNNQFPNKTNP